MRQQTPWVVSALNAAAFLATLVSDTVAAPTTVLGGRLTESATLRQAASSSGLRSDQVILDQDAPPLVLPTARGGTRPFATRSTPAPSSASSTSLALALVLRPDRRIGATNGTAMQASEFASDRLWGSSIQEVRFGLALNNVFDREHKSGGINAEAEVVFASPRLLRRMGRPRPYLLASVNSRDGADFAGVGLLWRVPLGRDWALEPDFAYVLHNGAIDAPAGDNSSSGRLLYGSRDLFRTTLGLERRLGDRLAVQVFVAHYSHGQILGHGRNQGSEEIGVRMVWRAEPYGARRTRRERASF